MKHLNKQKGFTIVELVIVIAVIAVLSAVLIPTFSNIVANAKKTADEADAKSIYEQYKVQIIMDENGIEDINGNNQEEVLVVLRYGQADAKYFLFVNGQMGESSIDADCDIVIDKNGKIILKILKKISFEEELIEGMEVVLLFDDGSNKIVLSEFEDNTGKGMKIEQLAYNPMFKTFKLNQNEIESIKYWQFIEETNCLRGYAESTEINVSNYGNEQTDQAYQWVVTFNDEECKIQNLLNSKYIGMNSSGKIGVFASNYNGLKSYGALYKVVEK